MDKEKTITYQDDDLDVSLTIKRANVKMGMFRTMLIEDAKEKAGKLPDDASLQEIGNYILQTVMYPSMISAVVEQTGFDHWPITYAEYSELPDNLVMAWENAVYDLNPHWAPQVEKKAESPSSGA